EPNDRRAVMSAEAIADEVVSVRVVIIAGSSASGMSWSWPPPGESVAGQHGVSRCGTPRTGFVEVEAGLTVAVVVRVGPVVQDRVEDLPGELDLLMVREQWRIAQQDVEDQPFVRLGTRLGEGLAVGEVHADLTDLHLRPRDLRPEPH